MISGTVNRSAALPVAKAANFRVGRCSPAVPSCVVAARRHDSTTVPPALSASAFFWLLSAAPALAEATEAAADFGSGGNADPKSYYTVLGLFLLSLPGASQTPRRRSMHRSDELLTGLCVHLRIQGMRLAWRCTAVAACSLPHNGSLLNCCSSPHNCNLVCSSLNTGPLLLQACGLKSSVHQRQRSSAKPSLRLVPRQTFP